MIRVFIFEIGQVVTWNYLELFRTNGGFGNYRSGLFFTLFSEFRLVPVLKKSQWNLSLPIVRDNSFIAKKGIKEMNTTRAAPSHAELTRAARALKARKRLMVCRRP
jgi:hypothetical protein